MKRTAPFSKAAIRNACLAALVPATLFGLYSHGNAIQKTCVPGNSDYEAGTGICTSKNRAGDEFQAKRKEERRQAAQDKAELERKANKWQPTKRNIRELAFACSQQRLKPFLKDPGSLRVLNRGMSELTDTKVTVWVDYNAINGFGGRSRDTFSCTYTR